MTAISTLPQLRTCYGTVVFLDTASGKLCHGHDASSPRNILLVAQEETVRLVHVLADSSFREIHVTPGPTSFPVQLSETDHDWPPIWSLAPDGGGAVSLRSDGLYLCAEPDGRVTLSRQQSGLWERFSLKMPPVAAATEDTKKKEATAVEGPVNIIFAVDDKYTEPFLVAILSVLCNTDLDIKFYIISTQNKNNLDKTLRILGASGISYTIKTKADVDAYYAKTFAARAEDEMVFPPHYYRLFAPDLFPDIQRALYLDSDLIVRADIGLVWDTDLDGHILAAVADPYFLGFEEAELRAVYGGRYFNSGVLLLDFSLWRAENLATEVFGWIIKYDATDQKGLWLQCWDQSPLNMALKGRWLSLSPTWNFSIMTRPDHALSYDLTAAQYDFISLDPGIFHFLGPAKPWLPKFACFNRFFAEYHRYRRMIQRLEARSTAPVAARLNS